MICEATPRMVTAAGFLAILCLAASLLLQPAQAQKPIAPPAPTGREASDQRGPTDQAGEVEKLKDEIQQLKVQLDELRSQNRAIRTCDRQFKGGIYGF